MAVVAGDPMKTVSRFPSVLIKLNVDRMQRQLDCRMARRNHGMLPARVLELGRQAQ